MTLGKSLLLSCCVALVLLPFFSEVHFLLHRVTL
jgi:hypothetical protein